jgi:mannose-6-phosphate isomerase
MSISFTASNSKEEILKKIKLKLISLDFKIDSYDFERPWGGFFVINESQVDTFIGRYFPQINPEALPKNQKLSPKILVVAPEKRLSWQYHQRRAEIWRVEGGTVGVVTSDNDEEGKIKILNTGDLITLKQGERHRLIGLDGWGMVAEIWQHTDAQNPSNEEDILRLQDDFGR